MSTLYCTAVYKSSCFGNYWEMGVHVGNVVPVPNDCPKNQTHATIVNTLFNVEMARKEDTFSMTMTHLEEANTSSTWLSNRHQPIINGFSNALIASSSFPRENNQNFAPL